MSDQTTPPEGEAIVDTPVEGTDTTEQPQIPEGYIPEDRYKEVQGWATRTSQELAQIKAQLEDPEQFAQLLEQRGYAVQGAADDEYVDPQVRELQQLRDQVAELSQWREGLSTEQRQQEAYDTYRAEADPQLKAMGVPQEFIQQVADIAAHRLPPIETPTGIKPDLQGAVAELNRIALDFAEHHPEVQKAVLEKYSTTKRAPTVVPGGVAATHQPDLVNMSLRELDAHMVEKLEANQR